MPDMSGRLLLMSGRRHRPCRTFCPAGFNAHKVINWGKCPTGAQNVRQGAEGLPDILSGMPEIIFAITATKDFYPPGRLTIGELILEETAWFLCEVNLSPFHSCFITESNLAQQDILSFIELI